MEKEWMHCTRRRESEKQLRERETDHEKEHQKGRRGIKGEPVTDEETPQGNKSEAKFEKGRARQYETDN